MLSLLQGAAMSIVYRYYCLGGDGRLSTGEWFDADNDDAAMALIAAKHPGTHCELWQSSRLVGSIDQRSVTQVVEPDGQVG